MKWGTFSLSQVPDLSKVPETFASDFKQFELAEELGFDTIWIAEHLFSSYGVVTSTQVLAAALAKATKKIKIGMAVVVLPFNHPLRTASDFALVDILSEGRLLFGTGRAYQPHEFTGMGIPMEDSRAMYDEALEIVIKAWTNEKIQHQGTFWTIPEPTEVLPKPVQKPHPPIYQAAISPESFTAAARSGTALQLASPFSYRTYREDWIDKIAESIEVYEQECVKHGHDPKGAERMMLLPFFAHENGEEAQRIARDRIEWFYAKVTANQKAVGGQPELIKGYEMTMRESLKTLREGFLSFDKLYEHGAAIADDPATCAEKLNSLRERLGITEFVLWTNIGGMAASDSMSAMRLIMNDIAPRVNEMEAASKAAE
ncbi:MAG: LLM class flavin-dependent oxidoreductase [Rhodospirillaceae bacterium]|jgi:alkanesulfonate monooxygenase SsuD/methylene tetrahydromethanopterin reductase-like flavin-dependent oxidoreductase (luciferase family)|nr:LLM class flavin-dependent oxidoreductase [Rhodospirillaceae bacterium]MBT5894838.1 LLM class flavin-dependent oxidoreductase [Rhodospirillaceae bacterium]MBT6431260.1 LLM class flavin-dependent oxidoreductase [Rhodospirillaceae bacterium]MBT7759496.1 LLM class flavin-dependent oxidoreductase [Rhodospirillaceae bacterium]